MAKIEDIEGIGPKFGMKLREAGVLTLEKLLECAGSPSGRRDLAERTGIDSDLILEWVNLADLFRIRGIGSEYADLLEEAGVDTVAELARRKPEHLYAAISEKNAEKKLVRRPPTQKQVESWVEQAQALPRMVSY